MAQIGPEGVRLRPLIADWGLGIDLRARSYRAGRAFRRGFRRGIENANEGLAFLRIYSTGVIRSLIVAVRSAEDRQLAFSSMVI